MTTVKMQANGNPLPHESKQSKLIELDCRGDREVIFKSLFPRLAELGHNASSRIVPRWESA